MKVDIMLPFYGDVDLMKQTVKSVLDQSNSSWRLTVVDDGYPDSTIPGWFKSLDDPRIRYFRNEKNLGANGNYRKVVELAEFELCLILGADDLLHEDYVEDILSLAFEFPAASIFHPGVDVIDQSNRVIETRVDSMKNRLGPWAPHATELRGEDLVVTLMHGNWMYFPAITWRTKTLKATGFRQGLNVCQDLGLAVDLIVAGHSMVVSPKKTFSYRRHHASDSSVRAFSGDRFVEEHEFYNKLALEFDSIGWNKASKSARLHITSRLHALTILPKAALKRGAVGVLTRHIFGF